MAIQKNIGKNTIGDNNKMSISLHDYNMSTHDLSTIVRNTQSPGTLVPNLCLVGQKGDTFDIDVDANVLTHPTTGPLFGSFKLEHHIYASPVRLYNSWLHNNRTGIGMKMSDIKLPMMFAKTEGSTTDARTNISSSTLYKYLGWTKSRRSGANSTAGVCKNGVPLLLYLDTFKNFFANTQENKFYMISNVGSQPTIKAGFGGTPSIDYKLPATGLKVTPKNTDTVIITIPTAIKNYKDAWSSIVFAIQDNKTGQCFQSFSLPSSRSTISTSTPSSASILLNSASGSSFS